MSEMLGNHYFLARKFSLAAKELEQALINDPGNKEIRRKLIICEIKQDNIDHSLDLFQSLVEEDAAFIFGIGPISFDCPCYELISEYEAKIQAEESVDDLIALAILYSYYDKKKSINYFFQALQLNPENTKIKKILEKLVREIEKDNITFRFES